MLERVLADLRFVHRKENSDDRFQIDVVQPTTQFDDVATGFAVAIVQLADLELFMQHRREDVPGTVLDRQRLPHRFDVLGERPIRRSRRELFPA